MKQKKKILSTYKRKIHIDGQEWTYQIRRSSGIGHVKVCSPDRLKKWSLEVGKLSNRCCDYAYCEDCGWCGEWVKNDLTPNHIRRLIMKRILGRKIPRGSGQAGKVA